MTQVIPEVDSKRCTGCGDCIAKCPTGAVELVGGEAVILRPGDCNYCTDCEGFCPQDAIKCPFEIILAKTAQSS